MLIALAETLNETLPASIDVGSLVNLVTSNPKIAASMILQIIMGFALGYIMAKAFKYIIGFIVILIAGSVLNVWSLGSSSGEVLGNFTGLKEYGQYLVGFLKMLSILLVGPITLGFFLGLIVGWLKK